MKYYADVKAKPDFVEVEKEILKFWDENETFEKSVKNRDGAADFVFYDGPPLPTARRTMVILWFLMSKTWLPVFRP